MRKILLSALLLLGLGLPAVAQTPVCFKTSNTAPGCQVVTPAAPLPVTGGGGVGLPVTIANGADVAEGATTDAAVAAGAAGTLSAKMRLLTSQMDTNNTNLGAPGATACATDTGSCSLNALLQRIAQRITTLIANIVNTIILQAGENHIGEVGSNILPITPTVTTTATTIASGESIGGKITLANAARVSGALGAGGTSGIIQDVTLISSDVWLAGPLDVYFFNADPSASTCTNDTAFSLNSADFAKVVGIAHVTDFTRDQAASGNFTAQAGNLAKTYGLASSTSIYACIVWRGANYTSAASSTTFKVNVLRN